jgi:hypothetical protein
MSKDINGVPLLDLYKINRASVEHFDKILGTFRQIIFAVNGAIITACLAYVAQKTGSFEDRDYKLIFAVGCLLAAINLLVWQLEKHYHRYLIVSAKISEKLERIMLYDSNKNKFAENMLLALTYQFREAKSKPLEDSRLPKWLRQRMYRLSRFIRTYDLLYMLPVILVIIVNAIVAVRLGIVWVGAWISVAAIFIAMAYAIIRYSYWLGKRYKGNKCYEDLDSNVWDGNSVSGPEQ